MSDVPPPPDPDPTTDPATDPAQAPPGPARPTWSGVLQLGLVAVPLQAYPAVASAPDLPRHLLHAGCGQRLRYAKHCPRHGAVPPGAAVKGVEYAPGQFLVLDEADLDALRPARDRALALDLCLDLSAIDPLLFSGRSLYLLPAGPAARPAYAVLAQALRQRRQGALGRLVLAGRRHLALVRPAASLLVLHLLHDPARVRGGAALEGGLRPGPVGETEARLAGLLLDAYTRPVRWADYRDDSARLLAELVEARLRGGTAAAEAPEEGPVLGLLDALRQSVAALRDAPPAPQPSPARRPGGGPSARRKSP